MTANHGEQIDRFALEDLATRYRLGRSTILKRISDLGIKRRRIGIRSYANAEQVALLDDLHQFITQGGDIAEFRETRGLDCLR